MIKKKLIIIYACAFVGGIAALSTSTLAATSRPGVQHMRAYVSRTCFFSSHTNDDVYPSEVQVSGDRNQFFHSALVETLIPGLISKSFDVLVGAIRSAGEAKSIRVETYRGLQLAGSETRLANLPPSEQNDGSTALPGCIQIVAARFDNPVPNSKSSATPLEACLGGESKRPLFATGDINFFVELEVHVSGDRSAMAFRPTCAFVGKPFISGFGSREYVVFSGFVKPKPQSTQDAAIIESSDTTVSMTMLGGLNSHSAVRFSSDTPLSPWSAFTMPKTKTPVTLVGIVVETKAANVFLTTLADVLTEQKSPITEGIKAQILPSAQIAAENARLDKMKIFNNSRIAFAGALRNMRAACQNYYSDPKDANPFPEIEASIEKAGELISKFMDMTIAANNAGTSTDYDFTLKKVPVDTDSMRALCGEIKE